MSGRRPVAVIRLKRQASPLTTTGEKGWKAGLSVLEQIVCQVFTIIIVKRN